MIPKTNFDTKLLPEYLISFVIKILESLPPIQKREHSPIYTYTCDNIENTSITTLDITNKS